MDKKNANSRFYFIFENNKIGLTMYQIESGGKITIVEIQSRVTEQRTHLFNFTLHIHPIPIPKIPIELTNFRFRSRLISL